MIISKSNEIFKEFKDFIKNTNKDYRYTVSDDLSVLEIALDNNLEIPLLLYTTELINKDETKELLNKLINHAKEAYEISEATYNIIKLKENHAGIIAKIKINEISIIDFFKKNQFIVVLDHLEIPGNVGTILRTLESINASCILVDSITKLNNPKITAASRGCNLIVDTLQLNYNDAQKLLLDNGYDIFLGEPKMGLDYKSYDYNGKIAIVVGNERYGINNDWYLNQHKKVYIPMEGRQNSINVSIAACILAYEAYMRRR
jgi:TrmH family RNA methyltransferase